MQYWLVKQEPGDYSWATFVKDGKTDWTGVRNFQARNHLKGMRLKDRVFFYHSGSGSRADTPVKAVMGVARVSREAFPDPTAEEGDWVSVELTPERALKNPVSLQQIKQEPLLAQVALLRQSRLSVMSLEKADFEAILSMEKTRE